MKLKAPQVTRESLLALQTMIRFDFARSVKKVVEEAAANPATIPAETTIKILMLTESMVEASLPLSIAMAMIDMTGAPNAWLPLNDDKFAMYNRIINIEFGEEDFKALPPEILEKARSAFDKIQAILRKDFDEAGLVDPQEMMRGPSAPSLGAKPPAGGMMN